MYEELQRLASGNLRRERAEHTLQSTALVHEAYLRLVGTSQPDYNDRAHFLGIASKVMRQILVDHSRRRNTGKRDGGIRVPLLDDNPDLGRSSPQPSYQDPLIKLDDVLNELEKQDARKAALIEMRFFGGLTAEESAIVLNLPVQTIRRELRVAQAWLKTKLAEERNT